MIVRKFQWENGGRQSSEAPETENRQKWTPFSRQNPQKTAHNLRIKCRFVLKLWQLVWTSSATFGRRMAIWRCIVLSSAEKPCRKFRTVEFPNFLYFLEKALGRWSMHHRKPSGSDCKKYYREGDTSKLASNNAKTKNDRKV